MFESLIAVEAILEEAQISDGIVPLGEFKAQAPKLLKRLGEHSRRT